MRSIWIAFLLLVIGPALAQPTVPQIVFDSIPDFLKLPEGMNFGEVPGVAVNSKGHVFVFTRSNSATGPAYAPAAAQLLEFAANGDFMRVLATDTHPEDEPARSELVEVGGPAVGR